MTKPNLSKIVYVLLEIAPLILIILFCIVFFIIMKYIQECVNLCSKKAATATVVITKIFSKMALVVFGPPEGIFRYEAAPTEELDEHLGTQVVYIRKKRVDNRWVVMLGVHVLTFGVFAMMVFWDIFLLSESHVCDDTTIDCFAETDVVNATSGPINDCAKFETTLTNNGTTTITCYTFTYAFGPALGAVGGLFTMIRIIMKIISAMFLWAYSNAGDKCKRCSCSFRCVFIFHGILIIFVLPIITAFVAIAVGFSTLSIPNHIQVLLFMLTLSIGIGFPWCLFTGDDNASIKDRLCGHNESADEIPLSGAATNNETTPINT
jgi:hypothetical protein